MRYKAEFAPCDLLCSRAGAWLPFARVAAALRADPGCVLSQVRARARRACSFPGSAWVPHRPGPPKSKRFLWPSDGRAGLALAAALSCVVLPSLLRSSRGGLPWPPRCRAPWRAWARSTGCAARRARAPRRPGATPTRRCSSCGWPGARASGRSRAARPRPPPRRRAAACASRSWPPWTGCAGRRRHRPTRAPPPARTTQAAGCAARMPGALSPSLKRAEGSCRCSGLVGMIVCQGAVARRVSC